MRYDAGIAPVPKAWLALDEAEQVALVTVYHHRLHEEIPNVDIHAALHVIVENQLAQELVLAKDALARLCAEGLDRHEAIHAIGSVVLKYVWDLLRGGAKPSDPNAPYFQALKGLTANSWREEFGTTRKRIPSGAKLPVMLTMRERDIIRDETFCNPDFAKCAAVEGLGIRMELSLDEIEEIQGYVAAEANHAKNAKRRKELDRLFGKLQEFLDTYDDQSE